MMFCVLSKTHLCSQKQTKKIEKSNDHFERKLLKLPEADRY